MPNASFHRCKAWLFCWDAAAFFTNGKYNYYMPLKGIDRQFPTEKAAVTTSSISDTRGRAGV
jgi:hypothetical protein